MITTRRQTIEMVIQHERQPCQRMPVGAQIGRESPADTVPGQSLLDVNVCCYEEGIVIDDEVVLSNLTVNKEGDNDEQKAKTDIPPDRKPIRSLRGPPFDLFMLRAYPQIIFLGCKLIKAHGGNQGIPPIAP
jgi:hypothetical protein